MLAEQVFVLIALIDIESDLHYKADHNHGDKVIVYFQLPVHFILHGTC